MESVISIRVSEGSIDSLDDAYDFLASVFSQQEVKTRAQFERLMAGGEYRLFLGRHDAFDTVVGYAFLYEPKTPKISWLDYIAIAPEYRDMGFGTAFFNALCDARQDRLGIMLEVEPATSADAETLGNQQRRITFYERLGARLLDVAYLFPDSENPYRMLLFFRPIAKMKSLPAKPIREMITAAYDYIHSNVATRHETLKRFIGDVSDHEL